MKCKIISASSWKRTPGFVRETPGIVRDTPGFVRDTPGIVRDTPGFVRDTHGIVTDAFRHVQQHRVTLTWHCIALQSNDLPHMFSEMLKKHVAFLHMCRSDKRVSKGADM